MEIILFFAGVHDCIGKFQCTFAALGPVVGEGDFCSGFFGDLADDLDLVFGVELELVDTDDRSDAGFSYGLDVGKEVVTALGDQVGIGLGISFIQRFAGDDLRTAAVHLESTDSGDDDGTIRGKAAETALDVPELFKTDVGTEAALGNMIVRKF